MMNNIIIGNRLHEVMKMWNEGSKYELFGYILQGKAIHILKKDKLWIRDCAGIPSFKHYVQHELHISVSEAHRLEQIYRTVGDILEKNDIQIKIGAITLLLPHLKHKTDDEKKDMLIEYKDLPLEGIKNNLLELCGDGHLATDVCEHTGEMEVYHKCKQCHKFIRVK